MDKRNKNYYFNVINHCDEERLVLSHLQPSSVPWFIYGWVSKTKMLNMVGM
jgi:hypothetical protein